MQNFAFQPFSMSYPTFYYPQTYILQASVPSTYVWPERQYCFLYDTPPITHGLLQCPYSIKQGPTATLETSPKQQSNLVKILPTIAIQNVSSLQGYSKGNQTEKIAKSSQKFQKVTNIQEKDKCKLGVQRFIKKNTQSNIINQIFSFLWSPVKSLKYASRIIQNAQKQQIYNKILNKIKINYKSQVNRFYLKKLLNLKDSQLLYNKIKNKIKELNQLDLNQFSKIMMKLTFFYLREEHKKYILTSKKMNNSLWKLHLSKCRQIEAFLFEEEVSEQKIQN